jgi:hypothetical protein
MVSKPSCRGIVELDRTGGHCKRSGFGLDKERIDDVDLELDFIVLILLVTRLLGLLCLGSKKNTSIIANILITK